MSLIIKKNKASLPLNSILEGDTIENMKELPSNSIDLIFADPPYGKFNIIKLINESFKCLNKNGKILLECQTNDKPFMNAIYKDFGNTRILFWEKYE